MNINHIENEVEDDVIEPKETESKFNNISGTPLVILEILIYAIIILIATKLITSYILQRNIVDGLSMDDTLIDGESLIVEKISYRFDKLDRFDIIAFYPNGKDNKEYYIKRIIGLPGEFVQMSADDIYINGELIEEDYGSTSDNGYLGLAVEGIELKEDEYFVLGDNRQVSLDSRYEEVGAIEIDEIEGKAIFRIWPLNRFGTID
ncbi:MAG TPA: signal peptidase I [Clostridiales bacterium]|nr:signal peptidase I [Clostridiales bacterium]